MQRSRRLATLGVVAISVTVLAGWQLLAPAGAREASRATAGHAGPSAALERELQRFLDTHSPLPTRVPPPRAVPVLPRTLPFPLRPGTPGGATCYVAASGCSETPCIEFARSGGAAVSAAPSAVVLRLGETVNRNALAPATRPSCQGRLGAPKTLRVSGP